MLTLYVDSNHISPYALSAFVALREKGLPFDTAIIDLGAGEQRAPEYRQRSVTARVPMLVHDGFALGESSAIAEYLEDEFPDAPRLFPRDVKARARARQLQAWIRSDLMALREERGTEHVFVGKKLPELSERGRAAADKLVAVTTALLADGGGEHLFGAWSIADTDLGVMLNRLVQHGDRVPAAVERYARDQWARPSVQDWWRLRD